MDSRFTPVPMSQSGYGPYSPPAAAFVDSWGQIHPRPPSHSIARPPHVPSQPYGRQGKMDYYAPVPTAVYSLEQAGPSRSNPGRDYLHSLGSSLEALSLSTPSVRVTSTGSSSSPNRNKPLPSRPPFSGFPRPPSAPYDPHIIRLQQAQPASMPQLSSQSRPPDATHHPHSYSNPSRPQPAQPSPPRTFKPSPYLSPPSPPPIHRSHSEPGFGGDIKSNGRGEATTTPEKTHRPATSVIDLTTCSDTSSETDSPSPVTSRSKVNRKRAASEQPHSHTLPRGVTPSKSASSPASPGRAVRCAGFTRIGQPCKRMVKVSAPYLAALDTNMFQSGLDPGDEGDQVGLGRYCKDHAGMICHPVGFYSKEKRGLWVHFDHWIPPELGQQTQTLLRMVMESKLTAKESPGFLYAYELRDLETPSTSFFKVGRTDNVPRRIGQWTNQCHSHTPTLRDIFPLSTPSLSSASLLPSQTQTHTSLLPGAVQGGTLSSAPPSQAVKRWERLVHLELADLSFSSRPSEYEKLREKCADCGTGHREIFALAREDASGQGACDVGGEGAYQIVLEVVQRWERFVRTLCE